MSDSCLEPQVQPIEACTVSRSIEAYDLLIEDMEIVLGERWGDLSFDNALTFLGQPEAAQLRFLAVALDSEDEPQAALIGDLIQAAKDMGLKVILIAEDVSPGFLHQLLNRGGDEFVPYPLPEGELARAIDRVTAPGEEPVPVPATTAVAPVGGKNGAVFSIQGLSGGNGASTFAVNLACELARLGAKTGETCCVIDLDLQFGSVASFLDIAQRSTVIELLSDTEVIDAEAFAQALQQHPDGPSVFAAPQELIPLDFIGPDDVQRIIDQARQMFDYVVIDMPHAIVDWTETVLNASQLFFSMLEVDLRSAQNCVRLKTALAAEGMPLEKLRFVLNRAPRFTDLAGRSRVRRLCESLDIAIEMQLPDGGRVIVQAADQGEELAKALPKNPLRKEIAKLAEQLHTIGAAEEEAA